MDLMTKMPAKIPCKFSEKTITEISKLKPEEKDLIKLNKSYIEKFSYAWKIDKNFKFDLPKSFFSNQAEKKIIDISDNMQQKSTSTRYASNNIQGARFNNELLSQIWEEGKFEIQSTQPDLPYTWKLSNFIIKGYNNIIKRYYKDMALSFKFFYTMKNRFSIKNYSKVFPNNFLSCFYHLYMTIRLIINSLIGVPLYSNNTYQLTQQIKKEDLERFIELNPDFNYKMYSRKERENIMALDQEYKNEWNNNIMPNLLKEYKKQKMHKNQILLNLDQNQKSFFQKFLSNSQKYKNIEKKFPSLSQFLISQQIINDENFKIDEEYKQKYEDFLKELNKKSIRVLCSDWKDEKIEEYEQIKNKEKSEKLHENIKLNIEDKKEPFSIYNFNYTSKKNLPIKLKIKSKEQKTPLLEFRAKRLLKYPYIIERERGYNNNYYYRLKKVKYYYVKSDFYFWRVWLFLIKLFTTFWNYNYRVINQMSNSMFGFQALYRTKLYRDIYVSSDTGAIYDTKETFTFPRSIINLITWVFDSREKFENTPDTGILSKNFSRILNLFLNYILRLTFLGLLLVGLYPTLIFINVIICLILVLISPIVAPLWNLLDYIFSIIIYNRYDTLRVFHIIRVLIIEFAIGTIIQFIFCSSCVLLQPLLSLFFLVYSQIHFIARYLYDFIFYYILKFMAKIPLTDTCIAWRISGPHLFRERFYDINNKDLMNLVIAEVEKLVMNNFRENIIKKLNEPLELYESMSKIYQLINLNLYSNRRINESISFYENLLSEQIKKADKYPELSYHIKIKFSEERLDIVKNMIEAYLRNYNMNNNLKFELDKYEEKEYEQLTEKILKNIFGNDILYTLDDEDKIVHLESVFENNLDEISLRIFENPKYDDRLYVYKKKEKERSLTFPKIANFNDIYTFANDLYLNISILDEEKIKKLFE